MYILISIHWVYPKVKRVRYNAEKTKAEDDRAHMLRLRVKEVAKEKGISMAKLSRLADLNPRTVQNIFRDPHRDVAHSTLVKIAKALGVTVDDLIEDVPDNG